MNPIKLGIAAGGEERLREATEAEVKREHQAELAAAKNSEQRAAIGNKIKQKIHERMKHQASPYSLWNSV